MCLAIFFHISSSPTINVLIFMAAHSVLIAFQQSINRPNMMWQHITLVVRCSCALTFVHQMPARLHCQCIFQQQYLATKPSSLGYEVPMAWKFALFFLFHFYVYLLFPMMTSLSRSCSCIDDGTFNPLNLKHDVRITIMVQGCTEII